MSPKEQQMAIVRDFVSMSLDRISQLPVIHQQESVKALRMALALSADLLAEDEVLLEASPKHDILLP